MLEKLKRWLYRKAMEAVKQGRGREVEARQATLDRFMEGGGR